MMLKVSETLVLGVDIGENLQETAISVGVMKHNKGHQIIDCVKVFYGEEAISLYDALTSPSMDGNQS